MSSSGPWTARSAPFGGIEFQSREAIQARIHLIDHEGNPYGPLPHEDVKADARNILSILPSLMATALGPIGQNIHFLAFPGEKEAGSFAVKLGEEVFEWKLPLGSLLPPKYCPVDGEELSGAWKYCPWHGVELREEKP